MKKLKKPAVLALLAVVLLSCVPERVQAVSVPEDELPANAEHGTSIFTQENTLHVTYHSNRVEYDHEKVGYNIYLETPCDYCIVQFPSSKGYETQHVQYIVFITRSGTLFDPYRVDGDGGGIGNTSRTAFSSMSGLGNGEETYDCYWSVFSRDDGWFNDKEWPAPRYGHSVISMPSQFEDVDKNSLLYLLGCCEDGEFPDCRISEGDGDNPAQNAPGGIPGSESNPEYDKELGRLQLSMRGIQHKKDIWSVISGTEEIYDNIRWKKITSTGFNVADNDYPFCRVQVKIKCEINKTEGTASDGIHGGESKPLKNSMKEEYMYKPMPKASSQLLTVAYSDISLSYFPKLMEEYKKEKPLVDSFDTSTMKLHYYLRVIVSDSLTVVPGQKSWKCGDWVDVTAELTDKGGTSSEPGHFDEDGDWVSDGDAEEVDTVITSGDETGEEAAEKQEEKLKEEKEKFDTDDIKSLLSQVGDFPKFIKKLFSFLPSWCLALYAFGFACMIVLLVIKTIRG